MTLFIYDFTPLVLSMQHAHFFGHVTDVYFGSWVADVSRFYDVFIANNVLLAETNYT